MLKRGFDIVLALLLLVLFAPVMALLALAVAASMGRPVLFAQARAGLGGEDFTLRKFRSMREANDASGAPLPDAARVTPVGRFLRRSRLDELPEFWHVLTGWLSFVGPRPLPRATIAAEPLGERRLAVRPGLTGLAQVSGNTLLTNEEKFAIDAYYAAHRSLAGDIGIVAKTVAVVLLGERRDEALIEKALVYAHSPNRRG